MNFLDGSIRDLRFVIRRLWRSPAFTLTVVMTLAVGISSNAAVFTITNAALFAGFPLVPHNDRIVYVTTTKDSVYYPDFAEWRASSTSLEDIALARNIYTTIASGEGDPDAYFTTEVTANMFALLGVRPILGRDFLPEDERAGGAPVAMLRYSLWQQQFAADPSVVGRSVRINGVPTTIVGVMPRSFSFPSDQDLWMPLIPTSAAQRRETPYARYAVALLADGVTAETARAELATISGRLASEYPETNRGVAPVVQTFGEWSVGSKGYLLYEVAFGAVIFVLLIVCANAANLMLERTLSRTRDVAIHLAVGASRVRAMRQIFLESFALSAMGGAAGWGIAEICLHVYARLLQSGDYTRTLSYAMSYGAFAYLAAVSIGTFLAVSITAAVGTTKVHVGDVLRNGRGGITRSGARLTNVLVLSQVALAVVLLANTGVLIRSFAKVSTADVGIGGSDLLSMSLYVPPERYAEASARIAFYTNLDERLASLPGVESIGFGTAAPSEYIPSVAYQLEGASDDDKTQLPTVGRFVADVGYFRTLGIPLIAGRDFERSDGPSGVPVAVVNARFASTQWPGENPIGKRLRLYRSGATAPWLTVVGVVGNVVQNDRSRQTFEPLIYLPYAQNPEPNMFTFARTGVPPATLVGAFRREVYELDPSLPVPALWPLSERLDRIYAFERLVTKVLLAFATVAVLLASVGLYASVSHAVGQRTQEIGVRAALGATARDIFKLVFNVAAVPVGLGLAIGMALAPVVNTLLASELIGVSPHDPATLLLSATVLISATALGCVIPARRALSVDPVVALRHE